MAKTWWIVASERSGNENVWHWDEYFESDGNRHYAWGGARWIRSSVSCARIREMHAGDHFVAYQAEEGILGFGRLASGGYESTGSKNFDAFDLRMTARLRLTNAIPLKAVQLLPGARETFEFVRAKQGTVHTVGPAGMEQLLGLGLAFNPQMQTQLLRIFAAA